MSRIIPKKLIAVEDNWQKELATAFSDPIALLNYLQLPLADFAQDAKARALFPMRVPRSFAARMNKKDANDPLFRQVFTSRQEFDSVKGYTTDPLLEQENKLPGLLHKYQSRVLLIVRGGCAVNCRYCFRRHFPYADNHLSKNDWQEVLDYIAADKNIDEVILSGGDPLMAKDEFLAWLCSKIEDIAHIKRLRIHTRLPVVIPSRITAEFLAWFTTSRLQAVMVIHVNHAQEVDQSLKDALQRLKAAGVTLLNQSVLLRGINDNTYALTTLSETLFDAGVMPYYLHLLDKVQGASHFDVSDNAARILMAELIKRLPGYLVPKLVREIGGQPGKTPLDLHLHPAS